MATYCEACGARMLDGYPVCSASVLYPEICPLPPRATCERCANQARPENSRWWCEGCQLPMEHCPCI